MTRRLYDQRITFRLSGMDKEDIRRRAMAEGITVTHLLRSIVSGFLEWEQKQRTFPERRFYAR